MAPPQKIKISRRRVSQLVQCPSPLHVRLPLCMIASINFTLVHTGIRNCAVQKYVRDKHTGSYEHGNAASTCRQETLPLAYISYNLVTINITNHRSLWHAARYKSQRDISRSRGGSCMRDGKASATEHRKTSSVQSRKLFAFCPLRRFCKLQPRGTRTDSAAGLGLLPYHPHQIGFHFQCSLTPGCASSRSVFAYL